MQELPSQTDFDPTGCDLDGQCAWAHFGGKTLDQAFARFSESPENYQEDFMCMGTVAFRYYFPVIDRFLRRTIEIPVADRLDRQSWILAQCIAHQFTSADANLISQRLSEAIDLCGFMIENVAAFEGDWDPPSEILERWKHLRNQLNGLSHKPVPASRRPRR